MKIDLDIAKIAFSDPLVVMAFVLEGREGVLRFQLSHLLEVKQRVLKSIIQETNELDYYITRRLFSIGERARVESLCFGKTLYVICRVAKPVKVLETGVASGVSTAYILKALEKNCQGELYSIDMPDYEKILLRKDPKYLPEPISILPDRKGVGWLVPNNVRHRWHLLTGLTKDVLPTLCKSLGEINIFLHDSEHTYKNMYFEYATVWPYLARNGYLLTDDAWWNTAFTDFCREINAKPICVYTTGVTGVRKKT